MRITKHPQPFYFLSIILFLFNSCVDSTHTTSSTLFQQVSSDHSNVHFKNTFKETLQFNFLNYSYIYNGGGVSTGDFNNDGLTDLYFTSNQNSNKLYLNKGEFVFNDITEIANVSDTEGWTTGTAVVDINNDGWLDIYVCKSGSLDNHSERKNKLFINQKNNTFKEEASKYNLDHYGFSTQAYFFDYDNDNDLDMYLVNHRPDFRNNINPDLKIQLNKQDYSSDQLFRNDNGYFTNVTKESGVLNKAWGLSASIGDFNQDDRPDIFVANDFLEPDFLYINQGDGTFKEEALKYFNHISANSMGSDFADINNDLHPDLIVLDMMAEDHIRSKENMATMSTENFNRLVNQGYHHQYMSNILQLNRGNGMYSEIGQMSKISKTDWSWAPLIADFDNDGFNDLFVTNGIENDLSNQDFRNQMRSNIINRKKVSLIEAIQMMPSNKLSNYVFQNQKNLLFKNTTQTWGLSKKVNSNGAIYADLDNDGDLDLVVNNQLEEAHIYQNTSKNNYIKIKLKGPSQNIFGYGTSVTVFSNGLTQRKHLQPQRGFQSSNDLHLNFGLEKRKEIDSIHIYWNQNKTQTIYNTKPNQTIEISYNMNKYDSKTSESKLNNSSDLKTNKLGINHILKTNNYDDFKHQLLLPQKQSEKKFALTVGDVNNDGLEDIFVGNSKGKSAVLYIQNSTGTFTKSFQKAFEEDSKFEDTDAVLFDVDNDHDLDLFISSGGYELTENHALLQNRLYLNNGNGKFSKGNIPSIRKNSTCVVPHDYDNDGDIDLFIGGGVVPRKYPLAEESYFLMNKKGTLKQKSLPAFSHLQIVNDAVFEDIDNDGFKELLVVGEWMPVQIFKNKKGVFYSDQIINIKNTNGWHQTIKPTDIDNDGDVDFIIGNYGANNKFKPSSKKPLHIYADYFDSNSSFDLALSKLSKKGMLLPVRGKECSSQQTPFIKSKIKSFKEFASSSMTDIYGEEKLKNANHYVAHQLNSFILKNVGNYNFEIELLPSYAQMSPTLDIEFEDFNNDGYQDIVGVGNNYEAEVETVRYDASKNYILLNDKKGSYHHVSTPNIYVNKESIAIEKILIDKKIHFIILNKNGEMDILKKLP